MMPGGWSGYSSRITDEQKRIFAIAMEDLVGADYEPIGIQFQIVAGTKFCYYCIGRIAVPNVEAFLAKVTVYQNPAQKIELQGIDHIFPS